MRARLDGTQRGVAATDLSTRALRSRTADGHGEVMLSSRSPEWVRVLASMVAAGGLVAVASAVLMVVQDLEHRPGEMFDGLGAYLGQCLLVATTPFLVWSSYVLFVRPLRAAVVCGATLCVLSGAVAVLYAGQFDDGLALWHLLVLQVAVTVVVWAPLAAAWRWRRDDPRQTDAAIAPTTTAPTK